MSGRSLGTSQPVSVDCGVSQQSQDRARLEINARRQDPDKRFARTGNNW
jgi:hypothetical protein